MIEKIKLPYPRRNNGNCSPKFTTMAFSLILIPTMVHPKAPTPCINILKGKIFKFVSKMPNSTKNVLVHFKKRINSNLPGIIFPGIRIT